MSKEGLDVVIGERGERLATRRVGDPGVSGGDLGNADDARRSVDDAGERTSGPVGVAWSEESGESRRESMLG